MYFLRNDQSLATVCSALLLHVACVDAVLADSPVIRRLMKSLGSAGGLTSCQVLSNELRKSAISHRLLGTPNDEIWPGVEDLPDYKATFPQWSAKSLEDNVAGLDDVSADLLEVRWEHGSFSFS